MTFTTVGLCSRWWQVTLLCPSGGWHMSHQCPETCWVFMTRERDDIGLYGFIYFPAGCSEDVCFLGIWQVIPCVHLSVLHLSVCPWGQSVNQSVIITLSLNIRLCLCVCLLVCVYILVIAAICEDFLFWISIRCYYHSTSCPSWGPPHKRQEQHTVQKKD